MNHTSKISPEQLLALTEQVIREAPSFVYNQSLSESERRWLGRAEAIIEAADALIPLSEFRLARMQINTYSHSRDALLNPLHTTYARLELLVPTQARGAFIPAGDTWNGYAALVKVIQEPCDDLLIVDPYINADLFTDLLPHSAARTLVRCLTTKRTENDPGLCAAARKWSNDNVGKSKPVEVRYAPPGSLHDRLIISDGKFTWLISQSLKDIAKRSPASVSRADQEISLMKFDHYNQLWIKSTPVDL